MRTLAICGFCAMSLLLGLVYGQEKDAGAGPNEKTDTVVNAIRSMASDRLSQTLREFYGGSRVQIVSEPTSNVLLLRVPEGEAEEVMNLLQTLDRPARSMVIGLQLLRGTGEGDVDSALFTGPAAEVRQRIAMQQREELLEVLNSVEMTVVEQQRTMFQVGKTVAVMSGSMSGGGRVMNSYESRQVGTLVAVQAVASNDGGIAISLQFEQSEIEPGDADDDQPVPATTTTLTHKTSVQLKDGDSVMVGKLTGRDGETAYLVLEARLKEENEAVSFRSFSRGVSPVRGFSSRGGAGAAFGGSSSARSGSNRPPSGFSRGATSRSSSGGSVRSPGSSSRAATTESRYQRYAAALIKRYDSDEDGKLSAEERQDMSKSYSDADEDGYLSLEELVKALRE